MNPYNEVLSKYNTKLNDEKVAAATEKIIRENFDRNNCQEVYKTILGCIDLTSLRTEDNDQSIAALTKRLIPGKTPHNTSWQPLSGSLLSTGEVSIYQAQCEVMRYVRQNVELFTTMKAYFGEINPDRTAELAGDEQVGHAVQGLQKIGQQIGQRKSHNVAEYAARRQILFHTYPAASMAAAPPSGNTLFQ